MLLRLTVTDFALLQKSEIVFHPGLTVITGETGAGKSLLVGALTFLAGGKPPFDVVREGARQAVIEGEFSQGDSSTLILRRQISSDGRSRAFIDDEPVGQKELSERASSLLDITSQRAFSRLLDAHHHLDLLDSFSGLTESRTKLQRFASNYQTLSRRSGELRKFLTDQLTRREFVRKQLAEIDQIAPVQDEETELSIEVKRLEHFEELSHDSELLLKLLSDHPDSVEIQLSKSLKLIESIAQFDATIEDLKQEMGNSLLTVREVARRIKERSRASGYEASHLEQLRERQHNLASLARRYGGSIQEVIKQRDEFRLVVQSSTQAESELEDVLFKLDICVREWVEEARAVSVRRNSTATQIEKKITACLADLGIGEPKFEVRLEKIPDPDGLLEESGTRWRLSERGAEEAVFYFSANPGVETKPLATVASGGELSRVMLALKESLPLQSEEATILFDEIDTGISGKTARLVGRKMKKIAAGRQLLVITHLPQIASLADYHYNVVKFERDGNTYTEVREIADKNRIDALASMISGGRISEAATKQAEFLLSEN